MNNTTNPIGIISWSLDVECPKCKEDFDAVEQDDDYVIATMIFNNNWDSASGCELTCPHCKHEFQIGGVVS